MTTQPYSMARVVRIGLPTAWQLQIPDAGGTWVLHTAGTEGDCLIAASANFFTFVAVLDDLVNTGAHQYWFRTPP